VDYRPTVVYLNLNSVPVTFRRLT